MSFKLESLHSLNLFVITPLYLISYFVLQLSDALLLKI